MESAINNNSAGSKFNIQHSDAKIEKIIEKTEKHEMNFNEGIQKKSCDILNGIVKILDLPLVIISVESLSIIEVNKNALHLAKMFAPYLCSMDQLKGLCIKNVFDKIGINDKYNTICDVLVEKETKYVNKIRVYTNNCENYWNLIFEPILNNEGIVEEIIIVIIDVTEEIKSKIHMENMLRLQEDFFANISHELKTPLNIIFSTAQLIQLYYENGLLSDTKQNLPKYIESIKQNSYRLSKLINNIVDISKIESGYFELKYSNNNIVEVVEEVVLSVSDFTQYRGINIVFDTDIEDKIISCDPEKIERILLNLISNAIKFSDKGTEILVNLKDKNDFVEISVKDSGIGIEPSNLEVIFDRFRQIDKSLSRNAGGTGIGLSLVKSLVELHGGAIKVESHVNHGSVFTFILPAKKMKSDALISSSKIKNNNESIKIELSDI